MPAPSPRLNSPAQRAARLAEASAHADAVVLQDHVALSQRLPSSKQPPNGGCMSTTQPRLQATKTSCREMRSTFVRWRTHNHTVGRFAVSQLLDRKTQDTGLRHCKPPCQSLPQASTWQLFSNKQPSTPIPPPSCALLIWQALFSPSYRMTTAPDVISKHEQDDNTVRTIGGKTSKCKQQNRAFATG